MTIEQVQSLKEKTVFSIEDPTRYGIPDESREVTIPHDSQYRSNLPRISRDSVNNPKNDEYTREEVRTYQIPEVGTVVFIYDYDTETSSGSYRMGAHDTMGPYLIEDTREVDAENDILESLKLQLVELNAEFFRYLNRHPELLYKVTPRKFEEIIAELLKDMGCEIHLTPETRDGGRDILAAFKTPFAELLMIVECKRYNPSHKIGVDIVERFLWVVERKDKASCGLIATTSYFSTIAKSIENEFKYKLRLKDFENLKEWIGNYGNWRMNEGSGLWLPEQSINKKE